MLKVGFIIILFQFSVVWSFSQTTDTKITIQKSKISVEKLLNEITSQSGIHFSYNPSNFDFDKKISFYVIEKSLKETLEKLTTKIPIQYTIIDNQIVLNLKDETTSIEPPKPQYYTLSGFISDKSTGESLIGATVFAHGKSIGISTNEFGFYSIYLPKGKHKLEYSYIGFSPEITNVDINKNKKRDVRLMDMPNNLPEVIIEMPTIDILQRKIPGKKEILKSELNNMPEFGSSSGLIKGLQAHPGVKTHSDGSAFFFVRGGAKDQNLIIIDDAPIYNPAHLFGFYSLVVPDFTKSIKLYKSDIPVNLGDRLSSVIDIRTKDGNLNKFEVNGATSLILNRISFEGPIVKGKSSFFASWRLSNFKWLYYRYVPNLDLAFGDLNLKWNYKLNQNNRFYFTLINGHDILANNGDALGSVAGVKWNNFAMTLRWNHIFNPKLFSNTILYTGNYQYELSFNRDVWHSGIGNLSLKSDFTWYNNSKITTKFGLELHGYFFNPGKILTGSLTNIFPTIKQDYSRQSVLYYNTTYDFLNKWNFSAGARFSIWSNSGPATYYTFDSNYKPMEEINRGTGVYNRYFNLDPRLSISYNVDSSSILKFSYGMYHQYMHLISNSTSPYTSFEVWAPSSPNIKPQKLHQFALGYVKYLPKKGIEFSAEAYYKMMDNQIDYKAHANTLLNPLIEGELRFGKMKSYGLELMIKKDRGKFNGWISYTYSRALRKTPEVNGGIEYPAFHDRPHDFSIMLNYNISRRLLFSMYWTGFTGSAFSSPTGFYTYNQNTVPIYGEKNNDRLPNYRRLDVALKLILNKNPENRYQHSLTLSFYNFLAHKNIIDINFNKILNENDSPIVKADVLTQQDLIATQTSLIRFLPSLTYKFKFSK